MDVTKMDIIGRVTTIPIKYETFDSNNEKVGEHELPKETYDVVDIFEENGKKFYVTDRWYKEYKQVPLIIIDGIVESYEPITIKCHNCSWTWTYKDGGDDKFICHKCGADNSKYYRNGGEILLALNGKPSNLTPEQYKLVRTSEFKNWYGDWENNPEGKLIDDNGEPLIVWRGDSEAFNVFGYIPEWDRKIDILWFTEHKWYAEMRGVDSGGFTRPFFIKSNEIICTDEIGWSIEYNKNPFVVYFAHAHDLGKPFKHIVVFNPNQIKLADGTNTTFDGNNPDIRFEDGGEIKEIIAYHGTTDKGFGSYKYKYYTTDYNYAKKYAEDRGRVEQFRITFNNPFVINERYMGYGEIVLDNEVIGFYRELQNDAVEKLKNKGYDIIIVNYKGINGFEVIPFDKSQVSTLNNNVIYADGGEINNIQLLKHTIINDFQSGSSLDFYMDYIFVVGDDAKDIVILNKELQEVNRVNVFQSETQRIPKEIKYDLETSTIVDIDGVPNLLILGSGAKQEFRSVGYLIRLDTKYVINEPFKYNTFVSRLKNEDSVKEINIEGCASLPNKFVMANRGNKRNPDNLLIITENRFWENQENAAISICRILIPDKDAAVSEIQYEQDTDTLFFTASIEHTTNAIDDGKIGDSFLGYINNISEKLTKNTIDVDGFYNLSLVDKAFEYQKIEGICIESKEKEMNDTFYTINLVSDNDNEESTIFKIRFKKPN